MNRTIRPVVPGEGGEVEDLVVVAAPRTSTTFTFSGASPAASAASIARRTSSRSPRRRIVANRSGRSESQLMFTRCSPAAANVAGLSAEQHAVGGEGEVLESEGGQAAHQAGKALADQWLAPGEPDRRHPEGLGHRPPGRSRRR